MPGQQLEDPAASSQILKQRQFSKDYDISPKKTKQRCRSERYFSITVYEKTKQGREKRYLS